MNTPATSPAAPQPETKSRLTKKLPTFRVGFLKQLDALRAYAVLSDNGTKPVHYTKVSDIIKVHEANVSSMNPFFLDNGFIYKAGHGYVPVPAVLEYNRAHSWKPETAAQKLQLLVANSWFGTALIQRLQFRSMSEEAAIEVLASECHAGPEAKPQLRMLLEYCEASGIIERANGQLTIISVSEPEEAKAAPEPIRPNPEPEPPAPLRSTISATSAPSQKDGSISLDIGIQVNLAEMGDWAPDRITAFFGGIAQILAAKNKDG
jgi:hypothetical protein